MELALTQRRQFQTIIKGKVGIMRLILGAIQQSDRALIK